MTWRPLSQLLAYVSKFPTLLYYKMMGITPLVNYVMSWNAPTALQNYTKFERCPNKIKIIREEGFVESHRISVSQPKSTHEARYKEIGC